MVLSIPKQMFVAKYKEKIDINKYSIVSITKDMSFEIVRELFTVWYQSPRNLCCYVQNILRVLFKQSRGKQSLLISHKKLIKDSGNFFFY